MCSKSPEKSINPNDKYVYPDAKNLVSFASILDGKDVIIMPPMHIYKNVENKRFTYDWKNYHVRFLDNPIFNLLSFVNKYRGLGKKRKRLLLNY